MRIAHRVKEKAKRVNCHKVPAISLWLVRCISPRLHQAKFPSCILRSLFKMRRSCLQFPQMVPSPTTEYFTISGRTVIVLPPWERHQQVGWPTGNIENSIYFKLLPLAKTTYKVNVSDTCHRYIGFIPLIDCTWKPAIVRPSTRRHPNNLSYWLKTVNSIRDSGCDDEFTLAYYTLLVSLSKFFCHRKVSCYSQYCKNTLNAGPL